MEHPNGRYSGWARLLFGVVCVTCAWFAALAVESATRLMTGLFVQLGADLPSPTLLTINAVQGYVPWIVAAASTLIIIYLGMRASAYFLHACTIVAAVAAVLASFAALSLVLPVMKCGFAWPEWPHQSSDTTGKAPGTARNQDEMAGSCR
jgi:hypothetical protein